MMQTRTLTTLNTSRTPQMIFWGVRWSALIYLSVLIALPLIVISVEGLRGGIWSFWDSITRPAALSAIFISVWTAALMTVINMIMGTLTAYVLVQYRFPGKRWLDSLIDLPFAIPTLVTGVMLILLYGPQTPIGGWIEDQFGMRIVFSSPGIVLALLFLGYPFVIRAVQPVLASLDIHQQEAAYTLGASSWLTFRRIVFPAILPAMITGGLLSFARALGEFGSIVIVSGNIPMRSQTAAVYIYGQVESGNLAAASSVSLVLMAIALLTTLLVDYLARRRTAHA
ncbi:MAG: sulfate ABC transporter permease subunit CysT [Anaerolineae bacterium]|jgi:sulfate transport system permease protein|nr:sulfate ABC transporter permease subunit CysT [Anaerolineae bacterium]